MGSGYDGFMTREFTEEYTAILWRLRAQNPDLSDILALA